MSEHSFSIINFSIQPDTALATFVKKKQFLGDEYISYLVNSSIELGYSLELIQDTCRIFLKNHKHPFNLCDPDYRQIIEKEAFREALVMTATQMADANVSSSNNSSNRSMSHNQSNFKNENDFFDDDDGEENDSNGYFVEERGAAADSTKYMNFDALANTKQYSSLNINPSSNKIDLKSLPSPSTSVVGGPVPITKKPMSAQQLQQQQQSEYEIQQLKKINDKKNLRPIIIDSNDVASSNNKQMFMLNRVKKVVEYFEKRNHQIYVIMSSYRREQIMNSGTDSNTSSSPTPDQFLLSELEKNELIHYTPAKKLGSRRIVCDDDTTMLKLAISNGGIIVSNDNFKRFINQSEEFKQIVEERVLMYSFIDDTFLPAEDPLGKNGPSLENFLRIESSQVNANHYNKRCPYKKKCTYGAKCKFWHPERGMMSGNNQYKTAHQSVLDQAQENQIKLQIIMSASEDSTNNTTKSPFFSSSNSDVLIKPPQTNKNMFSNLVQSDLANESSGHVFNLYGMGKSSNPKPTNWTTNSFGLDSLSLSDSKSFLINSDIESFKRLNQKNENQLNISEKQSSLLFMPPAQTKKSIITEPSKEENSVRARLLELVKRGDLTKNQVDKVLEENPNETDIEKLVFNASIDANEFDL